MVMQNKRQFIMASAIAASVAVLGMAMLALSRAATSSTAQELEAGSLAGNAQAVASAGSSGSQAVLFGSSGGANVRVFAYRLFGGSDDPSRIGTEAMKRYDVFLLSPSMVATAKAIKQQNPSAQTYMYKDPTSSRTTGSCATDAVGLDWGVDYCDANTNHDNWFMKKGGQRFQYNGYEGHWHMDVGASGYKEKYATDVLEDLRKNPVWNGVFMDNIMADITAYVPGGAYPDQYPTQAAGQQAYADFASYVGSQLSAAGFGTMGNNNGARLVQGLWNRYTAGTSGGYDEFWTTFGDDNGSANNLALYGNVGWEAQMAEVDTMHQQHKLGVFTAQTNGGGCADCRLYGYASYLLVADGTQAFAEGNVDGEVGDWQASSPVYGWDLGAPSGERTQPQTNLFQRNYSKGLVLVNADGSTSRTVNLARTYLDESGAQVTSVTVGATRGRILRLP